MTFFAEIFSIVAVLIGAIFIGFSILVSRNVYKIVQGESRKKWLVLSGLMCFFLFGYLGFVLLQLTDLFFPLELLVGGVFLGGAIFVLIVINLSRETIRKLSDFNLTLEDTVKQRTSELEKINKNLEAEIKERKRTEANLKKAKDEISADKLKVEAANNEIRSLLKKSYSDIKVRFENKNLLKCWEEKGCQQTECPAYRSDDLRCWQMVGTKCSICSAGDQLKHLDACEKCMIYEHVIKDPISSIGEQFNMLMDLLDYHVYQLEKEGRRAEQASIAKSEFLANMSHEIRTPMNGIIGFAELLSEMKPSDEQRYYIQLIIDSSHRLLLIINDILDFSKLEAHKLKIEKIVFNLAELIDNCLKIFDQKANEKGLALRCQISENLNEIFIGDPGRIQQVLVNLIGNAVKFTESGEIIISVQPGDKTDFVKTEESEEVTLHFKIMDTGIGIHEDHMKLIFESFSQADSSFSRKFGGTGLGLAISSQLLELMGGEIWVESKVDQGTTFHFKLTLKSAAQIDEPDDSTEQRIPAALTNAKPKINRSLNIILAEDDPINQVLAQALLEGEGHCVTVVGNGLDLLNRLENNKFDIALVDIQMPGMDGISATKAIRENEEIIGGGHFPMIAMTAHAIRGDKEKFLESGMDGYVSKPIDRKKLFDEIDRVLLLNQEIS